MATIGERVLQRVLLSGAKALGRAMESVLEDVGGAADNVSERTKRSREQIREVGMGRPPQDPPRRRKKKRTRDEDE